MAELGERLAIFCSFPWMLEGARDRMNADLSRVTNVAASSKTKLQHNMLKALGRKARSNGHSFTPVHSQGNSRLLGTGPPSRMLLQANGGRSGEFYPADSPIFS